MKPTATSTFRPALGPERRWAVRLSGIEWPEAFAATEAEANQIADKWRKDGIVVHVYPGRLTFVPEPVEEKPETLTGYPSPPPPAPVCAMCDGMKQLNGDACILCKGTGRKLR